MTLIDQGIKIASTSYARKILAQANFLTYVSPIINNDKNRYQILHIRPNQTKLSLAGKVKININCMGGDNFN